MRVSCTVVRTETEQSESFKVNVGLHQMSVLSPLLFTVIMDIDVVSCEIYHPSCCMWIN